ncbi:MAG: hypothetical protein WCK90_03655 [archaeon]
MRDLLFKPFFVVDKSTTIFYILLGVSNFKKAQRKNKMTNENTQRRYRMHELGNARRSDYACDELSKAILGTYPSALAGLRRKIEEHNSQARSDREGAILVALNCPCCSNVGSQLEEYQEFYKKHNFPTITVSPLPGIDRAGITFDFISKKYPKYGQNEGNDEEYIKEFVDEVMERIHLEELK